MARIVETKPKSFGFQWPEVLGTFISYNEKANEEHNFMLKLQKLKTILDVWNCRSHTLFRRCLTTESLGISQLVHSISNLHIPQGFLSDVNKAIFRSIWKGKKADKIKRKVMFLDYDKGGLQSPSIDVLA